MRLAPRKDIDWAAQVHPLDPDRLPSLAVVTMARDEGAVLRRWVDWYAGQVGAEHVIVLDDGSTDGSTDDLPCPVLHLPPLKGLFEVTRMRTVSALAASLLGSYDAVLFCDADELVVADPRAHAGLREFVAARAAAPAYGVMGLNVVHDTTREGPLDPTAPVLGQRTLAKFLPIMCKPSLKRVPAPWRHASHGIDCPYVVDHELWMFHLKFADRDQLARTAALRHQAHEAGRAEGTSWSRDADAMVALLDEVVAARPEGEVKAFSPRAETMADLVTREDRQFYRSVGQGQVAAMRKRPFVRIPPRFHGLL